MNRRSTLFYLALILLFAVPAAAAPSASMIAGQADADVRINTFMEQTLLIVKKFREQTTSLFAHVSLVQRAAGLNRYISSDCRIVFHAPDYLMLEVKGINPYTVVVSNAQVITFFPESEETDIRPLAPGEHILDDFLGIAMVDDYRLYDFSFTTEKDMYVLRSVMRPEARRNVAANLRANLHKAVQRVVWVKPRTDEIVKTQFITLGGDDITLTFRDQWVNISVPQF